MEMSKNRLNLFNTRPQGDIYGKQNSIKLIMTINDNKIRSKKSQ